jgi:hypothetical protein
MIYFNTLLELTILGCLIYLIHLELKPKTQKVIEYSNPPVLQSTRKSRVIKRDENDQIIKNTQ